MLGTRRVHCNVVYNEYIQNKEHIHMNATRVSVVLVKSISDMEVCTAVII